MAWEPLFAPQRCDQAVARDPRSRATATKPAAPVALPRRGEAAIAVEHLERAEDPEVHRPAPTVTRLCRFVRFERLGWRLAAISQLQTGSVMSQVAQATISPATQVRSPHDPLARSSARVHGDRRSRLILAPGRSPKADIAGTANVSAQPSPRTDGGPESHVAASVGSRPAAGPEPASRVHQSEVSGGPDESRIAPSAEVLRERQRTGRAGSP